MKIDNLCMSFGTQVIFDNASFQVNNNDKVGIIGVNGAGDRRWRTDSACYS